MERAKRDDRSFSRKRSFTFGAYGGWVKNILSHIRTYIFQCKSVWVLCRWTALFLSMSNCLCQIHFPLQVVFTSLFAVWTDSHARMSRGEVLFSISSQPSHVHVQPLSLAKISENVVHVFWWTHTCCCRHESEGENIVDVLESPAVESKTFTTPCSNHRVVLLSCPSCT